MDGPSILKSMSRREKFVTLFISLALFDLFVGDLVYNSRSPDNSHLWLQLAGSVLFLFMTIFSFLSIFKNWTAEKEDQLFMRTAGYLVLVPIMIVVAIFLGFALFSTFGWLATIPSWAAVIIVLLVLIYLK